MCCEDEENCEMWKKFEEKESAIEAWNAKEIRSGELKIISCEA